MKKVVFKNVTSNITEIMEMKVIRNGKPMNLNLLLPELWVETETELDVSGVQPLYFSFELEGCHIEARLDRKSEDQSNRIKYYFGSYEFRTL